MKKVLNSKYYKGKGVGKFSNALSFLIIFLAIISLIYLFYPVRVLNASDFKSNEYLKAWKVKNHEIFSIEYMHSVEKSPVIENFRIDGKDVILVDTYFHSYGAGLPATTPYKTEITDKGIHVYDINLKIEDLIYRTGGEERKQKLILRDKDYMVLDFSSHRTGVRFDIRYMTNLSYIMKECDLF